MRMLAQNGCEYKVHYASIGTGWLGRRPHPDWQSAVPARQGGKGTMTGSGHRPTRRDAARAAGVAALGLMGANAGARGAEAERKPATAPSAAAPDGASNRIRIPKSETDPRVRRFVAPQRIVWQSEGESAPENSAALLALQRGEASLAGKPQVRMKRGSSVLLDFGRELYGGIQICGGWSPGNKPVRVRVRFGESVSEAMTQPNQDHAIHDSTVLVPFLGVTEIGNTGFRFVRLDAVDEGVDAVIQQVRAVFLYRDLEYKGSFESDDARLNEIWRVGAYTVHLNLQEQLWDGVKRDRLPWVGDMHPEMAVINSVFGHVDVLPDTLDAVRDVTPLPEFMNNMGSWSLWWVLIQRDWYRYHGDIAYLRAQRDYLVELLDVFASHIDDTNTQRLPGAFVDWPTRSLEDAVEAGVQAHMVQVFEAGAELCAVLGETGARVKSLAVADRLRQYDFARIKRKSAVAFMVLAGVRDAGLANRDVLSVMPLHDVSTFNGYYVLEARAKAGDHQGCIDLIRDYWGQMLDLGATTFWENFDITWVEDSAPIDELVPAGRKCIHADHGDWCYVGLRHSLCHGWGAGPTAWLIEHVLGFRPLAPGSTKLLVAPHLGDLQRAAGTFPTPRGVVRASHVRDGTGAIRSEIDAPSGIEVVRA